MRSAAAFLPGLVGLVAGLASVGGCGKQHPLATGTAGNGGGGSGMTMGASGTAGGEAGSSAGAGAAGSSVAGTMGGGAGGPVDGAAPSADGGPVVVTVDAASAEREPMIVPITGVVPTLGCGRDPGIAIGMGVQSAIATMGTKDADCADTKCGPWSYLREYYIYLPVGYDRTKAYPLVFEMPGCGGRGLNGFVLDTANDPTRPNVDNTVIRVGLTPPPNDIGHATNPSQGCFDESEGDDSVDFVFYESLYDQLQAQLCFDKNRVFAAGGGSGGGRMADELACKYAGDDTRPIRGTLSIAGDWPTPDQPKFLPTCTAHPTTGIWIHSIGDMTRFWARTKLSIERAMFVNGCFGNGFDAAKLVDFPVDGEPPNGTTKATCQKIDGCPSNFPLVVCLHHDNIHSLANADPGFATFIKLFENPPLLTQ